MNPVPESLASLLPEPPWPRQIKMAGRRALLPAAPWRTSSSVAWFRDVGCLGTFGALNDLKFHRIPLLQGTVSVAGYGPVDFPKLRRFPQDARNLPVVHSGPMISPTSFQAPDHPRVAA